VSRAGGRASERSDPSGHGRSRTDGRTDRCRLDEEAEVWRRATWDARSAWKTDGPRSPDESPRLQYRQSFTTDRPARRGPAAAGRPKKTGPRASSRARPGPAYDRGGLKPSRRAGLKPAGALRSSPSFLALTRTIITLSYVIDEPHCDAGRGAGWLAGERVALGRLAAAESVPLAHTRQPTVQWRFHAGAGGGHRTAPQIVASPLPKFSRTLDTLWSIESQKN